MSPDLEFPEVPCAGCQTPTSELALFPGGICLECYRQTPEASAPLTTSGLESLARVWRGGKP